MKSWLQPTHSAPNLKPMEYRKEKAIVAWSKAVTNFRLVPTINLHQLHFSWSVYKILFLLIFTCTSMSLVVGPCLYERRPEFSYLVIGCSK
jgi:hypothetical protein